MVRRRDFDARVTRFGFGLFFVACDVRESASIWIRIEVMPAIENKPLTVSQLTESIKNSLTKNFSGIFVEGEVSEISHASSGHFYFSLKDAQAKLSCVIWKSVVSRIRMKLEPGMHILCWGDITVYPPRGNYQLSVGRVEAAGRGQLQVAFEQLKSKLAAAGYFDPRRKRPILSLPRYVAVVTSPDGDALRDFLQVLDRRHPKLDILIIPTRVQGEHAAREIARAIRQANRLRPLPDVLVVCRGGGSLEDLWSFNEEVVCQAIYQSEIPVITGICHETDVTLADHVADVRALTPSEAAERVIPPLDELLQQLAQYRRSLRQLLQQRFRKAEALLQSLSDRPVLRRPFDRINLLRQQTDDCFERLNKAIKVFLSRRSSDVRELAGTLHALSPLTTLARGYSVTSDDQGRLVRSISRVSPQTGITTRVADGTIESIVTAVIPQTDSSANDDAQDD